MPSAKDSLKELADGVQRRGDTEPANTCGRSKTVKTLRKGIEVRSVTGLRRQVCVL
jgi:hypothetical protein